MTVHDGGAKRGEIRVLEIVIGNVDVDAVARRFGSTVHSKVLGRRYQLQVMRIVALQAFDKLHAQARGEKWILAKGLHAAAPARIAKDVDVRRPESEPCEAAVIVVANGLVVLGAAFDRDDLRDPAHECGVPGGREADGLREIRRKAVARHAVQRFVPPVVGRHAQTRNGRRDILHLAHLFLERHAADDILGARLGRKRGIEIRAGRGVARHGWSATGGLLACLLRRRRNPRRNEHTDCRK